MDERNDSELLDSDLLDSDLLDNDLIDHESAPLGAEQSEPDDADLEVGENEDHILEEGRRLLAAAEAKLAAVERALERLDSGNYGLCEMCGTPIAPAMLTERPSLARCVEHEESA